jgi:hypothetical protein
VRNPYNKGKCPAGALFVFLRCGVDHHTVNFLRQDATSMQHMAFSATSISWWHRDRPQKPKVWDPRQDIRGQPPTPDFRRPSR